MITLFSQTTMSELFHRTSLIVFAIAMNNLCPSGETLADIACNALRLSSIWFRMRVFNCKHSRKAITSNTEKTPFTLCRFRDCGISGTVVTSFFTINSLTRVKFTKWTSCACLSPLIVGHSK